MKIINLRGHHLLCLQGYQGYGYDQKFKENMDKIFNSIKEDVTIKLINDIDDLCSYCPNLEECKDIEKKDDELIKIANLEINKEYSSKELFKIVNKNIKTKNDLEIICKNCQWTEKCIYYNKLKG